MPEATGETRSAATYDINMRPNAVRDGALSWYSPADAPFHVAGLPWFGQERLYRRLPKHPPYPLPEAVDYLADSPAGGQIRFQTNSRHLSVRVRLTAPANMVHMPATGQCGIDCYLGSPGQQHFLSVTKYDLTKAEYECGLLDVPESELRNITLNLPLYQGVEEVLIGLDHEAELLPPPAYADDRPIVVYGTSNTQGGCASRPGMAWTNILSRRFNRECINMGFSGSGKGEADVARNLALIPNPGCFVLDYEGNAGSAGLRQTLAAFIRILRAAHPAVPILVLSVTRFTTERVNPELVETRRQDRAFQQDTVAACNRQGDANVYFQDGAVLLGDEFEEATIDGVHLSDLGFLRMADGLEPVLRSILG